MTALLFRMGRAIDDALCGLSVIRVGIIVGLVVGLMIVALWGSL